MFFGNRVLYAEVLDFRDPVLEADVALRRGPRWDGDLVTDEST